MSSSLVNGKLQTLVPANDRALLYGDGLFETVVFRAGHAPLWPLHWQRFEHGCQVLGLLCPDPETVLAQCRQLCSATGMSVIRFQLSRGSGGRAYWPDEQAPPRLFVQGRAWPAEISAVRQRGLRLHSSSVRLASDSSLAGLKHCNRLEQVMAARECARAGFDEALLFNGQGRLVEAIASNLILELDGKLVTPDAGCGVAGVGLRWIMEQAGLDIQPVSLDSDRVTASTSIVVINSVAGPRMAVELDGRSLSFSSRCRALQQLWVDSLW